MSEYYAKRPETTEDLKGTDTQGKRLLEARHDFLTSTNPQLIEGISQALVAAAGDPCLTTKNHGYMSVVYAKPTAEELLASLEQAQERFDQESAMLARWERGEMQEQWVYQSTAQAAAKMRELDTTDWPEWVEHEEV